MIKKEYREEIYLVALVLLGLYLSLIENIIPKPFPWMKIGLSNISVLIALEKFNSKMALQTILLRVFIQALMLGTLFTPNFIISFSAGLISTLFMIFLYKFRKYLSLLEPKNFVGFAPQQTEKFISVEIKPILEKYKNLIGMNSDLRV